MLTRFCKENHLAIVDYHIDDGFFQIFVRFTTIHLTLVHQQRIMAIASSKIHGYVCDEETGLYYLRSRYYGSDWCRFVNIDGLIDKNIYQYCLNSPIGRRDTSGFESSAVANKPDYTKIIDRKLKNSLYEFIDHKVGNHKTPPLKGFFDHASDYLWFVGQVTHKAKWDLKHDESWAKMFPNLDIPAADETFLYRGELITREALGNITFGYLGTAMGCSPEVLYLGGGVAKRVNNVSPDNIMEILHAVDECLFAPYYGDDENDHYYTTLGIRYYWDDHTEGGNQ